MGLRLAPALVGLVVVSVSPAAAARMPQLQTTAAAQQRAEALTLGKGDFPAGWKPDPTAAPSKPFDLFGTPCRSIEPDLSGATIVGWSAKQYERFTSKTVQLAEHGVFLFATPAQAQAMYERWALTWATRCMRVGRTDGNSRIVSVSRFRPAAPGVTATGFRYLSTQKAPAARLVYVDAVFLRSRSVYSMLIAVRTDKPFDQGLESALIADAAKRIA